MSSEAASAFARCVTTAGERLDDERRATLEVLVALLKCEEAGSAGRTDERHRRLLAVRFQQTMGAVMAKGVEDTAFYRWTHLVGLCEVGGAPERFAITGEELHAWASDTQRNAPLTMTCLSTHDAKRSEDVRARLGVLSESAGDWSKCLRALRNATVALRPASLDGRTENLLWQTLVGTWTTNGPLACARLQDYLVKAAREAMSSTSWTAPDERFEAELQQFVAQVLEEPACTALLAGWVTDNAAGIRAATLGYKLVQLMLPGVADVYQGTEGVAMALVDPDNRRPVDFASLAVRLEKLDAGQHARDLDAEKLLVTARALRVRRDHHEAFTGDKASYEALAASTGHAFAFTRGVADDARVVVVATRLAMTLERLGSWQQHHVMLPDGHWACTLSGREFAGGRVALQDLLVSLPVALLVRRER